MIEATRRLAFAFVDAGQLDRALRLVEEAESAALETGDSRLIATTWAWQATFPLLRGDFDGARQQTERALALRERIGDEEGVALSRARLSLIMLMEGRTTEALRGLEGSPSLLA